MPDLKYWRDGLPHTVDPSSVTHGEKYWSDGLPLTDLSDGTTTTTTSTSTTTTTTSTSTTTETTTETTTTSSTTTTTTTSTSTTSTTTTTTSTTTTAPFDGEIEGVLGYDLFEFGEDGEVVQERVIVGLAGLDVLLFGSDGEVLIEVVIFGSSGMDLMNFGAVGGKIEFPPQEIEGLAGFSLIEFGSGSIHLEKVIRGSRGMASTLRFGLNGFIEMQRVRYPEYKDPWTVPETDVYFRRQNPVPRTSARYLAAEAIDLANGDSSMIAPWRMPRIAPASDDILVTVSAGEEARLDIIALAIYNRSDWWWILALANDFLNPFEEPRAGDRIRVPSVSRIQSSILGRASSGDEVHRFRE